MTELIKKRNEIIGEFTDSNSLEKIQVFEKITSILIDRLSKLAMETKDIEGLIKDTMKISRSLTRPNYVISGNPNTILISDTKRTMKEQLYGILRLAITRRFTEDMFLIFSGVIETDLQILLKDGTFNTNFKKEYSDTWIKGKLDNITKTYDLVQTYHQKEIEELGSNKTTAKLFFYEFLGKAKIDTEKENNFLTSKVKGNIRKPINFKSGLSNASIGFIKRDIMFESDKILTFKQTLMGVLKPNNETGFNEEQMMKLPFIGMEMIYKVTQVIPPKKDRGTRLPFFKTLIRNIINEIHGTYLKFQKMAFSGRIGNKIGNVKRRGVQRDVKLNAQYKRLGMLQYESYPLTGYTNEITLLNTPINVTRTILMYPPFVFDRDYIEFIGKVATIANITSEEVNKILDSLNTLIGKKDAMESVWERIWTELNKFNKELKEQEGGRVFGASALKDFFIK